MSIQVIGIDHIYVAVSDMENSERFYDRVMAVLGFRKNTFINEEDWHIQYYNRHFGFVLRPARSLPSRLDPMSPGLHHFCFRVEDSATVDAISKRFAEEGISCSPPPIISRVRCGLLRDFLLRPGRDSAGGYELSTGAASAISGMGTRMMTNGGSWVAAQAEPKTRLSSCLRGNLVVRQNLPADFAAGVVGRVDICVSLPGNQPKELLRS